MIYYILIFVISEAEDAWPARTHPDWYTQGYIMIVNIKLTKELS